MYYYADGDQQKGPIPLDQMRSAGVKPETLVWREGMGEWQRADAVPELASLFAAPAQQPFTPNAGYRQPVAPPPYTPPAGFQQQAQPGYATPAGYAPPAAGYPQQVGYAGPMMGQTPPSQGLSIASLVLGILAIPSTCFYGFGIVLAILAVILGHIGHSSYKKQTGRSSGMAIAGLICGYVSLIIVVLIFLFFVLAIGVAASSSPTPRRW